MERRRKVVAEEPTTGLSDEPAKVVGSVGGSLTVTWGEETIQPIQFNGLRFGGLSLTVPLRPGDNIAEAYRQAWELLDQLGREQFEAKLAGWKERVRAARAEVTRRDD